ncbi:MAG: hypothetical protein Q9157_003225 [Trypethelium eluteriae]
MPQRKAAIFCFSTAMCQAKKTSSESSVSFQVLCLQFAVSFTLLPFLREIIEFLSSTSDKDAQITSVLLSSITGVAGHLSQVNYAAANALEDALVRHRVAAGLAGVSLDLPGVTGTSMISKETEAQNRVEALSTVSVPVDRVLDLVESAIKHDMDLNRKSSSKTKTPDDAQVVVNLVP